MATRQGKRAASLRRRGRRRPQQSSWLLLTVALVAVIGLLVVAIRWRRAEVPRPLLDEVLGRPRETVAPGLGGVAPDDAAVAESGRDVDVEVPPAAPEPPGHVAIVIDDLGRSLEEVKALAELGIPLSYSVLPYETRTREVASDLARRQGEILVHLPMEAANGKNPGPGALSLEMSRRELEQATARALDAVPEAVGVNNHMGSRMTDREEIMATIFDVLSERQLFFLDSRTSTETVAYRVARRLGLPTAERQVFLDTDPESAVIEQQFRLLLDLAREQGAAIAIGHPYESTLAVLRDQVPAARAEGFTFVPVSFLLDRAAMPEE